MCDCPFVARNQVELLPFSDQQHNRDKCLRIQHDYFPIISQECNSSSCRLSRNCLPHTACTCLLHSWQTKHCKHSPQAHTPHAATRVFRTIRTIDDLQLILDNKSCQFIARTCDERRTCLRRCKSVWAISSFFGVWRQAPDLPSWERGNQKTQGKVVQCLWI